MSTPTNCGAFLALAVWCLLSSASVAKTTSVPGFRFVQLTDNAEKDWVPRVSDTSIAPLVVWIGEYQLPGASSVSGDKEVFLWDGHIVEQLTDDDIEDHKPVVNGKRHVAWQKWSNTDASEIFERYFDPVHGWVAYQVTNDPPSAEKSDRYPEINRDDVVVWGRLTGAAYSWALHRLGSGLAPEYNTGLASYRPKVNDRGHVSPTAESLRDLDQTLLLQFDVTGLGYHRFLRAELNHLDQMLIEAQLAPGPDKEGPRDILFWDGTTLNTIHQSDVWAGRGDLNDAGRIAFEGLGGLPGSTSGTADREIFAYDTSTQQLVQLTDDEVEDRWATVAPDGTVIWQGAGSYPDGTSTGTDTEIMVALPEGADFDADGVPNQLDVCPLRSDPGQIDSNSDGRGDACSSSCGAISGVSSCADTLVNPGVLVLPNKSCGLGAELALLLAPLAVLRARRRKPSNDWSATSTT